jgi:FlaA1/EpsC-like NDP-sugar epimerase
MGSSGSLIPIFQEQIARGGPVTITHPEVSRYLMSIPEAAQLIETFDAIKIKHKLQAIIPEYTPEFRGFPDRPKKPCVSEMVP